MTTNLQREKKIYLTKGRLKSLDLALTMDDILYEKHRRLTERLHIEQRKLSRMGNVIKVLQRKPGGIYVLQITDIKVCPEGQIVEVL